MAAQLSGTAESDDRDLIAALRGGDVRAFRQLYLERFEQLCTYAATLVGDDEAADVVQETLWALWNGRAQLVVRTGDELLYYLLRAVRNRAVDAIRRTHSRDARLLRFGHDVQSQGQDSADEPAGEPRERLMARVDEVIAALPARSREMLVLRWYHGLGLEAIASIMGISYGSARVLHSRALAAVKARLGVR